MNILISVPGISHAMAASSDSLKTPELLEIAPFCPTTRTLDVFPREMKGIQVPGFWGIGIPHWPMEANCTNGVAGPGLPREELFVPESTAADMVEVAGKYDKWRPYPAQRPVSQYARKIARKFSTKRGKFFEHIFKFVKWETIFWVEHAPASLVHLDKKATMEIFERIMKKSLHIARRRPDATFVCFSPYGVGRASGFVVSNRIEASIVNEWEGIRRYLNGKLG